MRASIGRDVRNEGGSPECPRGKTNLSRFSHLSRLAPSVTRVVIFVSRHFARQLKQKETARSLTMSQQNKNKLSSSSKERSYTFVAIAMN